MSGVSVKNTLAFLFPGDAAQPAVMDMVRFVKTLNGDPSLMHTAYKISDEKSVFIRFKCEEAMNFVLANNEKSLPFHYSNGNKVTVRMSVAGNTRYVRVFDLPPEVSDADLAAVMQRYGKVKRTVREKFPAEYELDMFTGVRGLYMDIEKEIPDVLHFRNRKGRIYYEGVKLKCFACKSDTHLKKGCPVVRERQRVKAQKQPTAVPEAAYLEEEEDNGASVIAAAVIEADSHNNEKKQQKAKKMDAKRQRSFDTDRDSDVADNQTHKRKNNLKPSLSESDDSSLVIVPDASPNKCRVRIPTYEWISDEKERQSTIEEDKQRIAIVTNTPVDEIDFYHD